MYTWIDSYVRLPNKVLITTRLRDFKGDYPVEVKGMDDVEARKLVLQTSEHLGIASLLNESYTQELIDKSEGHPYVIKILLGEVAKRKTLSNIPLLVAGTEDILVALFERTYAALTPCAQRAFLTLSAWNSMVPRLALEAVLIQSTEERNQVEKGVDMLLQYSMAESQLADVDNQEFIGLPLVASVFGKKKLNINPYRTKIITDVEILQMLGPSRRNDLSLGLAKKLERFITNISRLVENGANFEDYSPILEMICRTYNPGWIMLSRWHLDSFTQEGYKLAKVAAERFLENEPNSNDAASAWSLIAHACYQTADALGEIYALIERSQFNSVPFYEVSNAAYRFSEMLKLNMLELDREQKTSLVERLLTVLNRRCDEANAVDYSRMAWLEIHLGREA